MDKYLDVRYSITDLGQGGYRVEGAYQGQHNFFQPSPIMTQIQIDPKMDAGLPIPPTCGLGGSGFDPSR